MLARLIKGFLVREAGVGAEVLERPGLMVSDLGLDSLSLVEMIFEVEDRCGFQLSDPQRFQTMSFDDMVAAIEAEVRQRHDGELPDLENVGSAAGAK